MKNIVKIQKVLLVAAVMAIIKVTDISAQLHEFSAHVGGGLSSLSYQLSRGDRSGQMGGDFGVGYTYLRSIERVTKTEEIYRQQWGVHTGIGLGFYNAKANLNKVETVSKGLNDGDERFSTFDLYTKLTGYNELQKAVYLNIPVMALFKLDQYYIMGGFKFGIPVNGKYKSENAILSNRAYYPELDNEIVDLPYRGLGNFKGKDFNGKLDLGVAVMLSLEGGITWRVTNNIKLYTGLYFDYGLNNISKGDVKRFINYSLDKPSDFTTNTVLSSYTDNSKSATFTDKAKVSAIGIQLRLAYWNNKRLTKI